MANPLYNQFGNQQANNPMAQIVQQVMQFQRTFNGDPKAQVEQMMRDGRLSQEQFNQLAQQANAIAQFMGMMPKN